jgi:hypothetical protein
LTIGTGRPDEPKPVAFHQYLTDGSGAPMPIFRFLHEPCPDCASGALGVTFDTPDGRAETVQCLRCDYALTRPKRDPPERRMNQGRRGVPSGGAGRGG